MSNIIRTMYSALPRYKKSQVRENMREFFGVKTSRVEQMLIQPDEKYTVEGYLFMYGQVSSVIPTDVARFAKHIGKEAVLKFNYFSKFKQPLAANADQVAYTTNQ